MNLSFQIDEMKVRSLNTAVPSPLYNCLRSPATRARVNMFLSVFGAETAGAYRGLFFLLATCHKSVVCLAFAVRFL